MKWISYGPESWLLQFAGQVGDEAFARGRAITTELERHPPPGLVEFVPSFTSVLLEFSPGTIDAAGLSSLAARLRAVAGHALPPAPVKEIPVVYDGPDLGRVAEAHGLTTRQVEELHSATLYKVYLLGFAPGFPYLGDLDARLHTPRLAVPRPRVAAGSVAIGGEHTGIYSVDSPGGWNIIGHTAVRLFDPARAGEDERSMFLLKPGDRVRFVPTDPGAGIVSGAGDSPAVCQAADPAAEMRDFSASGHAGQTTAGAGESPAGLKAGESPAPLPGRRTPR